MSPMSPMSGLNQKSTVLLALWLLLDGAAAFSQPKLLVVGGNRFDFGRISRGAVLERKLSLKNPGTDTLILGHVDVSCGCTGTVVSTDRIPPGGTGTILITFNSKNFAGPIHKTVTVNSNAADAGKALIEFTGNVIDEIALNPPSIFLQDAEVKHTSLVTLKVTNNGTAPLALTGFRTALKGLVLKLPQDSIAPGSTSEVRVEFTPDAAAQVIADGVFVTTSNIHQPEIYIQVFGGVKEFRVQ